MHELIIVTSDARLGQVILSEADACGVQAQIKADLQGISPQEWERVRAAVVDLDGKMGGSIPEQVRVLGLCRDPESLPLRARRMAHVLFRRPWRMADLRAELRLLASGAAIPEPMPRPGQNEVLQLLSDSRCVLMGNRQISLSDKEFAVLSLLVQKGEAGVSKQELQVLLDCEHTNEAQVYICHLRRKLEQAFDLQPIKTVRNKGYVYVGN